MSVQSFDLRHEINNFESVVRLLSQRVTEQIELLQILKLCELQQKLVKISQFVVSEQKHLQKFILFQAIDIFDKIILAVNLLAPEVGMDVIQVFKLSKVSFLKYLPYYY